MNFFISTFEKGEKKNSPPSYHIGNCRL